MARYGMQVWCFVLISALVSVAMGVEFRSDRMNNPPGVSRVHIQVISNVTGNITVAIPANFSLTNSSNGSINTSVNVSWLNLTEATVNFTLASPSGCLENDFFRSSILVNGSVIGTFPFICVPDSKIVDFKVEYGHGNANYLGIGDELVIPNQSAVLFNLVRVFNLGYLLTPNENPENASLYCQYELLPVRTFGPGEVGREQSRINMSYFWSEIRGGFWFRIGVLSQDFTPRPPGTAYNVSCQNVTYQFSRTRVVAPFTNFSLLVRTEYPFTMRQFNDTQFVGKNLYLIQNTERYTVHKVKIVFSQANQTAVFEVPAMPPNQSLIFRVDNSTATNLSIYFIPSWFAHSTDPRVLVQSAFFGNASILPSNLLPRIYFPGNLSAITNGLFSVQINGSDPEGSTVTFQTNTTLFNVSTTTGIIQFTPNSSVIGNYSIMVNVTDNESLTNQTVFNLEIKGPHPPSDANVTRGGFGPDQGNLSSNFSLIIDITNTSGVQLGNRNGTINYSFTGINADSAGDAIATQVIIGQGFVTLNSSAFPSSWNTSVRVTFFNTSCPHNQKPVVSLLEFVANVTLIQGTGRDCVSVGFCSNTTCTVGADGRGNASFTVNHFTGFSAFGNANLTIANNGPVNRFETVVVNASFVNRSTGALISDAVCNISFSDEPSRVENMTSGDVVFSHSKKMDTSGTFLVNITCARPGVTTISAVDNLTVISLGGGGGAGAGSSGRGESAGRAVGSATEGPAKEECVSDWECNPWTPCIGGDRRRICRDRAQCGVQHAMPYAMPLEVEPCEVPAPIINVTFKPTCSDSIQNQGEEGIDCGGPCSRRCELKESKKELPGLVPLSCGDGRCAKDEVCFCPQDCGLPPASCPQNVRTLQLVMLLALLVILVGVLLKVPLNNRPLGISKSLKKNQG